MSLEKYLNSQESILFRWHIGPKGEVGGPGGKKIKENILGITNKRIFHFKKLKGYDRIYRDVPLKKVSYLENAWHNRNFLFLIIGTILLIIGLSFFFMFYPFFIFIGFVLLIPGIILIVKGLKQYGYLLINGEDWKFLFYSRDDIKSIENFIREVYFIKTE